MRLENDRYKILLLITNLGKGGAQRAFYDQAIALSAYYDIVEAVFDNTDERIYNSGFPIFYLSGKKSLSFLGALYRLGQRSLALRRLVKREKIDLVISHMDGANWVSSLSRSQAKKIFVVHGTILHDKAQSALKQWFRKSLIIPALYQSADHVICVSEGISTELIGISKAGNISHIPNFFDIAEISAKSQASIPKEYENLFTEFDVLISAGRLAKQKKQSELFSVFRDVKKQRPSARLVILGDGELRGTLIRAAADMGLSVYDTWNQSSQQFHTNYDIYFLGYIENPHAFLRRSKLFLLPSGWEGFPLALCEAMISQVTVLSADCPTGPREILSPGSITRKYKLMHAEYLESGVLLPMFDKAGAAAEWTNCIIRLLNDSEQCKAMRDSASKRMRDFDKKKVMEVWRSKIEGLRNDEHRSSSEADLAN